ncbi:hypothetical protein PV377_47365 [Streptomyces ipomoeae]|uniref:hypothetical protein n=1 Tax=Streptomyces ipomoeae TaxID=103232 RepID=UPI0029BF1F25|nr:hypothetical protein [Streptomyces ipomoeae]MDX2846440.1 hypothetical protein [Streptomyces ipomoeae]
MTAADELRAAADKIRTACFTGAVTMLPAVAALVAAREPIAKWLEAEAAGHEAVQGLGDITTELINVQLEQTEYGAQITHSTLPQALAVARAILGTQETP